MSLSKRVIIQGIPAGLILLLLSATTEQAGISAYVSNVSIDVTGWMISTLAYNLMVGFLFAFVFNQIQGGLKGDHAITKGLTFGFIALLIGAIPSFVNSFLKAPSLYVFIKLEFITAFVGYPLMGTVMAIVGERYCKEPVPQTVKST
ncbi:MAG: hypothetical protein ABIH39_08860 [Candidatus Margulisiibacteriota bacterium]